MGNPLISIVTPSLNQARFIEETILSVLGQDYPQVEYVVVDGGSSDETIDILRTYEDRLRWLSETDRGQADAVNKGWRMCRGEIIAYLNADDTYTPGALAAAAGVFAKHPGAVMVYGDCDNRFPDGSTTLNRPPARLTAEELIDRGNRIFQPASFYRRTILERVGFLDPGLQYWMDYDLSIKLLHAGPAVYLDRRLATFRVHPEQKSADRGRLYREARMISRRHGGRFFSQLFWEHHRRLHWMRFQGQRVRRLIWGHP
ncbi:MAG TPA: glycosyltransferase family 2 protein [Nitrospiria bacterium]|nr:glycosyltransferase family 2 protein [Nitrospiria bacterium]